MISYRLFIVNKRELTGETTTKIHRVGFFVLKNVVCDSKRYTESQCFYKFLYVIFIGIFNENIGPV